MTLSSSGELEALLGGARDEDVAARVTNDGLRDASHEELGNGGPSVRPEDEQIAAATFGCVKDDISWITHLNYEVPAFA